MCGVVGIIGHPEASTEAYQALLLMQHRGQDAAGIMSQDQNTGRIKLHKKTGLVDAVFNKEALAKLTGNISIGHTRYSTIGATDSDDIQPSAINYPYGIGLAHNGNIVNTAELKIDLLNNKKRHVFSNNDSEILINILAEGLKNSTDTNFFEQLANAVRDLQGVTKGAYAVVGSIAGKGLFAFRDPNGIRPLSIGKKRLNTEKTQHTESFCFSSESNVLNYLDYHYLRDLDPGELIYIDNKGSFHNKILIQQKKAACMFEWVYFANPESSIEGQNIYQSRLNTGTKLAEQIRKQMELGKMDPEVVVPVPETSRVSSISLAENIGIPYRELLIKNRYIQRSFILNDQASREKAVERKLSPIGHEIKGKKILLVDDSIVRGTTSKHIIKMMRKVGAKEVYFAAACPPILNPCFYGIDFPYKEKLLAYEKTISEIRDFLGADRIIYLGIDELKNSIGKTDLCMACLNGEYPVSVSSAEEFKHNRIKNKDHKEEINERS